MWIQTLPSSMQANILSFLSTEHSRFHSRDLEMLCRRLLSSKDLNFWVLRAAEALLLRVTRSFSDQDEQLFAAKEFEMPDYDSLPAFLLDIDKDHQIYPFSWLPLSGMSLKDVNAEEKKGEASEAEDKIVKNSANLNNNIRSDPNLQNVENCPEIRIQITKDDTRVGTDVQQESLHEGRMEQLAASAHDKDELNSRVRIEEDIQVCTPLVIETSKAFDRYRPLSEMEKARSLLGDENFSRAETLRESLLHSNPECGDSDIMEGMKLFRLSPDLPATLSVIKPWEMNDDVTLLLVKTLLGEDEGFAWSTKVLNPVLLQKLISLKQTASRELMSAVLLVGQLHPRATVDALLLPLLTQKEIFTPQCNVINRLIKECFPPEVTSSLCKKLFNIGQSHSQGANFSDQELPVQITWTETSLGVIQTILSKNLLLEQGTMDGLVLSLEEAAVKFAGSLKFGNILLSIVTKYGSLLKTHKSLLQEIVKSTNTFMTKSLLAKLETW
ncbi:hypothetical protein O6H91_15G047900 [Diphasiastrum complanatum]|nr:hypothetical protein O6H91_15G047900 [Diphasiastrum complanatum]